VGLCGVAMLCIGMQQYRDLLRLALNMAAYTYGAMLGIFLLALLPFGRDARGLWWGVPFALLTVLALSWQHVGWVRYAILVVSAMLAAHAAWALRREPLKIPVALAAAALVLSIAFLKPVAGPDGDPAHFKLAFPWLFPIGTAVTLGLGVALGRKRLAAPEAASVSSAS